MSNDNAWLYANRAEPAVTAEPAVAAESAEVAEAAEAAKAAEAAEAGEAAETAILTEYQELIKVIDILLSKLKVNTDYKLYNILNLQLFCAIVIASYTFILVFNVLFSAAAILYKPIDLYGVLISALANSEKMIVIILPVYFINDKFSRYKTKLSSILQLF